MRRSRLLIASLFAVLVMAKPARAHEPNPLAFDPVGYGNRAISNPYGYGFRGATGQGLFSGMFRPYVIDGPGTFRGETSQVFPFHRRSHLGNIRQAVPLLLHRYP